MTREKRQKKRAREDKSFLFSDEQHTREKQKARELRQSPWWRRKIAGGICYYCGEKFPPQDLTMDHKIPLARGGLSEKENLVPACKDCNNNKKYMLPFEWEAYLDRLKNEKDRGERG